MAGSNNDSGGGDDIAAAAARELNDLRIVFANIAGYKRFVGLRSVLKLKEVKAQIAEGDVNVEDLESAWLEACAVKGVSSVDPEDGKGGTHHVHQRSSWGVCTELSFEGFVHFLRLCEEKASLPTDLATATEASPKDPATGRDLVAARHRMVGLLRATLTVHQRGGGGEEEENDHPGDLNAPLGETLHTSMVRAAVEEGLAHHNPDKLHELMRTGVYKESEEGVQLDRDEKKASLRHGLLDRKFSHHDLVRSGIILKEQTPGQLAGERALAASRVSRHLQQRSAGSAADLFLAAGRNGVSTAVARRRGLANIAATPPWMSLRPGASIAPPSSWWKTTSSTGWRGPFSSRSSATAGLIFPTSRRGGSTSARKTGPSRACRGPCWAMRSASRSENAPTERI
ncbi:unnamed protein product [Ectocarpus sp. 4 AP-2014]